MNIARGETEYNFSLMLSTNMCDCHTVDPCTSLLVNYYPMLHVSGLNEGNDTWEVNWLVWVWVYDAHSFGSSGDSESAGTAERGETSKDYCGVGMRYWRLERYKCSQRGRLITDGAWHDNSMTFQTVMAVLKVGSSHCLEFAQARDLLMDWNMMHANSRPDAILLQTTPPLCKLCFQEPKDQAHFITRCPRLESLRSQLLQSAPSSLQSQQYNQHEFILGHSQRGMAWHGTVQRWDWWSRDATICGRHVNFLHEDSTKFALIQPTTAYSPIVEVTRKKKKIFFISSLQWATLYWY